jgi:hypothetical protein
VSEVSERQKVFFKLLFGRNEGFMCIAFASPDRSNFKEEFYRYPEQLDEILFAIASY